jgi:hypothetical protein
VRDWALSRRELLKRLGVGVGCLPLLQATRSYAAPPLFPRRFVCVMQPLGYRVNYWLPPVGPLGALPDSSSPLEPHEAALIFLGRLTNPGYPGCESCGHGAYGTLFAGGAVSPGEGEYRQPAIPTVDQVIADGIAASTTLPLHSLALQVMADANKTVPLGGRRCFWRGADQPVEPQGDPTKVAALLFPGKPADDAAVKRLAREQRSLLDYVGGELQRYRARLGTEDRLMVEAHIDSLREIERALAAPAPARPACASPVLGPPLDVSKPENFPAVLGLQLKLMVAALRCDVTRVATLQIGDALASGFTVAAIPGVPRPPAMPATDWESVAHAPSLGGTDLKRAVDKWCMGQLADLLAQMKGAAEGSETLLDHAAVLWATPMEDGASHNTQRLPWLLAGKCGGHFKTGVSAPSGGQPLGGVLAELCNAMGVPVPYFGAPSFGRPMRSLRA